MNIEELYNELSKIDSDLPYLTETLLGGNCSEGYCHCREILKKENDINAFLNKKMNECQSIVDVSLNALMLNPVIQFVTCVHSYDFGNEIDKTYKSRKQDLMKSVTIAQA